MIAPIQHVATRLMLCVPLLGAALAQAAPPEPVHLHYPAQTSLESPESLIIHGALDIPMMTPILEDFHHRHPGIDLTYRNLTTLAVNRTFLADTDNPDADVVMSSAMPWQYQLANQGYAQPLDSPESHNWPEWARWRQELFGVTFEPIVFVYHRDFAEQFTEIANHAQLLRLLEQETDALRGRVVTYDPARSGAGYTYAIEEARLSPRYWELVSALGKADARLVGTTQEMLEGLAEGRYLFGYNLLGSYAAEFVRHHPKLTLVVPDDYALAIQRLAFIPRTANNPHTAQRYLTYLLSEAGQRTISEQTPLGAVHPSLEGPGSAVALRAQLGDALRPIRLGPGLLATLDDLKRENLLSRWKQVFQQAGASYVPLSSKEKTP